MGKIDPSDLSDYCDKLWELDVNRLVPGEDFEIDLQGGKRAFSRADMAADSLFKSVKDDVFQRPTYKAFYDLLDNYERETGVAEEVTREEKRENWEFLDLVVESEVMQFAHQKLVEVGEAPEDTQEFKKMLYQMWFSLYRRETRNDSSGFEHVFVGECRDGKVTGFHNWIQFYLEEKSGRVDYKGYVLPRRRGGSDDDAPDGSEQLVTIQFAWEDEIKSVSSTLIGVSPEFELALYTLCFLGGEEDNEVTMGGYDVNIKCYRIRSKYGDKIGTSYPEAR
eukprot:GFYU01020437.1.p1 GENE.GFYU01020437.1~~GFYU01020437.1.p1  ORF type:complete len:279 (-),score=93.05 GFYU01020437.1:196-1032(-)